MTKQSIAIFGLCSVTLLIAFWRLILMPYQQGTNLNACLTRDLSKVSGAEIDLYHVLIDVCEARTKYPSW